jgi:TetR/AcrR family transcriptional regulator, regulator of mycofactocin system
MHSLEFWHAVLNIEARYCHSVPESMADFRAAPRRGRPPTTSARELELAALRLFTELGYDATTVDMIAAEAGASRRTFFRYFDSKASVLWHAFDREVASLREALSAVTDDVPLLDAIRIAVVSVNHYTAADLPELRQRMNLIGAVPALQASAAVHYDAWEQAVIDCAAARLGQPTDALLPLAIGRATLAVCRAAYEYWAARADQDLTVYLDAAIRTMAAGFPSDVDPVQGPRDQSAIQDRTPPDQSRRRKPTSLPRPVGNR